MKNYLDNLKDSIKMLRAVCHDKSCTKHEECPQTHDKCKEQLDLQTAMAWMVSYTLHLAEKNKVSEREARIVASFAFQSLGQHTEAPWFREDIQDVFDIVSMRLGGNFYMEGIK